MEETERNIRTGRTKKINKEYYRRNVFPYYNTFKITKRLGFDKFMQEIRAKKTLNLLFHTNNLFVMSYTWVNQNIE